MFFPERIRSISPDSRVLEIGPGSMPHPRSDLYLERRFEDEDEYLEQCGMAEPNFDPSKTVYYDGGRFPFDDNEFDYVICSHVLEHIPESELDLFISELERIAPCGYLEFPSAFFEIICFPSVHRWFLNHRNDTIILLDKASVESNWFHKSMREMWYANDQYLYRSFDRYKLFFFIGFEWKETIQYQIVSDWDQLVTESDYDSWKYYFQQTKSEGENSAAPRGQFGLRPLIGRVARYLRRKFPLGSLWLDDREWR